MIHTVVYTYAHEGLIVSGGPYGKPGGPTVKINTWLAVRKVLENTGDHILWVVTTEQLPGFLDMVKKYNLDKYIVVGHRDIMNSGTTNRNYPDRGRRLKVFIMKGKK